MPVGATRGGGIVSDAPDMRWSKESEILSGNPSSELAALRATITQQAQELVKRVVSAFGASRCMFATDWPVCMMPTWPVFL